MAFSFWLVSISLASSNTAKMNFASLVFVVLGLIASSVGYFIAAVVHGRLVDVCTVFVQVRDGRCRS